MLEARAPAKSSLDGSSFERGLRGVAVYTPNYHPLPETSIKMTTRKSKVGLLFAPVLFAAAAYLTPTVAKADYWVNWDVKYTGTAPASGMSIVFYGVNTAASTFNGSIWWPFGEAHSAATAPTFTGFSFGPADATLGGAANTDLKWAFATSPLTTGNGVHVGAQVVGPAAASSSVASVFFRNSVGQPIPGSQAYIVELNQTFHAPGPIVPAAAGLPATLAHGQTASAELPVQVPVGSRVVLFHKTTDAAGNFTASAFTESDSATQGTSAVTVSVANNFLLADGSPGPTLKVSNLAYAVLSSTVKLADLNPDNPLLSAALVSWPLVQSGAPAPALPPWAFVALGCTLVGAGFLLVRRRRFMTT